MGDFEKTVAILMGVFLFIYIGTPVMWWATEQWIAFFKRWADERKRQQ